MRSARSPEDYLSQALRAQHYHIAHTHTVFVLQIFLFHLILTIGGYLRAPTSVSTTWKIHFNVLCPGLKARCPELGYYNHYSLISVLPVCLHKNARSNGILLFDYNCEKLLKSF